MAVDPNCSADGAIWSQDGNPWWMSPDIELNWPGSRSHGDDRRSGVADPAVNNKVRVPNAPARAGI